MQIIKKNLIFHLVIIDNQCIINDTLNEHPVNAD